MRLVLDASVALAWVLEDEASPIAERVLQRVIHDGALAPPLFRLEVGNALLMAERRERIRRSQVETALDLLRELPIRIADSALENELGHVVTLARAYELTTYDASYLELALRTGSQLATLDDRLRQAAEKAQVALFDG